MVRYLAAWVSGCIAAFILPAADSLKWGAAALLSAVMAAAARRCTGKRWFQAAALLCAFAGGAAYSVWRVEAALHRQWQPERYPQSVSLQVTVTGLPEQDERGGTRFTGDAYTADGRRFRLLLHDYRGGSWQVGQTWQISARVRAAIGMRNPVGFDREAWALANGIDGMASVGKERTLLPERTAAFSFNRIRAHIIGSWQTAAQHYPQGAGLMTALAVGDRSGLDTQTWAALRPLGLNHLISISGLHVGMVALWAAWLAKRLLRLLPRVPRRPRVWTLTAAWLAAAGYCGLAGFGIPALRSLIMLTVFAAAWLRRSSVGVWQTWWTALAAVLLYQPASVLAAGFWLSFGLVAALLWACGFRLPEQGFRRRGAVYWVMQFVRTQWAATLAGALATVYLFGLLPPFSPLANTVAIPLFSWLLTPLALTASLLPSDSLKTAAAFVGEQAVSVLLYWGGRLPETAFAHAPLPLAACAAVAVLLLLLPRGLRLKPLACCALAAFALYRPEPPREGSLNITVWDVGQGLAVLLQTRNSTILFDTGTAAATDTALLPNLRAAGVTGLHALILSHHDDDHDGGYAALRQALPIDTLWAGQPEFYSAARHCTDGTNWQTDGVFFEFTTPTPHAGHDNDKSCVLRVISGSHAVMITGDLGKNSESRMVEKYGSALRSSVLVLGHHGSRSSTGSALLNAVSPQIAIASSGFGNAFRHPHHDVENQLSARQIRLLRTDTQGAIAVRFDGTDIQAAPLMQPKRWWQRKPFAEPPP